MSHTQKHAKTMLLQASSRLLFCAVMLMLGTMDGAMQVHFGDMPASISGPRLAEGVLVGMATRLGAAIALSIGLGFGSATHRLPGESSSGCPSRVSLMLCSLAGCCCHWQLWRLPSVCLVMELRFQPSTCRTAGLSFQISTQPSASMCLHSKWLRHYDSTSDTLLLSVHH